MRRLLTRGRHGEPARGVVLRAGLILLVSAAFTAAGASAWAYWTAPGVGTANACQGSTTTVYLAAGP